MLPNFRKGVLLSQGKRFRPLLALMLLATLAPGVAQEFDAIVTEHNQKPWTIADEIANRAPIMLLQAYGELMESHPAWFS